MTWTFLGMNSGASAERTLCFVSNNGTSRLNLFSTLLSISAPVFLYLFDTNILSLYVRRLLLFDLPVLFTLLSLTFAVLLQSVSLSILLFEDLQFNLLHSKLFLPMFSHGFPGLSSDLTLFCGPLSLLQTSLLW